MSRIEGNLLIFILFFGKKGGSLQETSDKMLPRSEKACLPSSSPAGKILRARGDSHQDQAQRLRVLCPSKYTLILAGERGGRGGNAQIKIRSGPIRPA